MPGVDRVRSGSFEAEISTELAKRQPTHTPNSILVPLWALRDLSVAASGGGYLVGTDVAVDSLADLLRGLSVVATLPVTRLPNLVNNVLIPQETAAPTA